MDRLMAFGAARTQQRPCRPGISLSRCGLGARPGFTSGRLGSPGGYRRHLRPLGRRPALRSSAVAVPVVQSDGQITTKEANQSDEAERSATFCNRADGCRSGENRSGVRFGVSGRRIDAHVGTRLPVETKILNKLLRERSAWFVFTLRCFNQHMLWTAKIAAIKMVRIS
jgi:hypothetical protein